jgi:hypothetical protein
MKMLKDVRQQWPPVRYSLTKLGGGVTAQGVSYPGGLDLTTPSLSLQPGALRNVVNYEVSQTGGYGRIDGYERYDGHASPSQAAYTIVAINFFSNTPTVGQTLTQAVSGATGVIIAVSNPQTGFDYLAVTQVTGVFDYTHNVSVGATLIGTAITPGISIGAQLNAIYLAAAADVYRANIAAVPGSGAILDVVHLIYGGVDTVFAFRANIGGTAVAIYQASAGGWTLVPLYNTVSFTAGGAATPLDGQTLTQGGVTAVIKRVVQASGAWTGTAAGIFVVVNPTGGNFGAGAATVSVSGASVTLSGAQTPIVINPGGVYEHVKTNFSGQITTRRIYGCDGVNKAFELSGDGVYTPITTGLSPDAPNHLTSHKNFLFLSQASSMFFSAVGFPYKWSAVDGAGEIATGDTVTGMITLPGSQTTATLAVFLASNTAFLYGTDPTPVTGNFNFVSFNTGTGGRPRTVQNLFDTFVFDNLGVINLKTTLNYGNFLPTTLTKAILPYIIEERNKTVCSCVSHDKSQYRVFFSDGGALFLTMINQQYLGCGVVQFPNPVNCVDEDDSASTGGHVIYFGSSDGLGYVYQMDVGTSFDGAILPASMTLAWDPLKSPRIRKRFRAASIEVQGNGYAEIQFGYQLSYGSTLVGQPTQVTYPSGFAGTPFWDQFVWDNFVWDGQTLMPTDVDMTGTAENVQVSIGSSTNYIAAYQVNSVIYHWSQRRGMRV